MGSGFNQVRLSRTEASSLHSDIYQLPVGHFCWTTNLQSTVHWNWEGQWVCTDRNFELPARNVRLTDKQTFNRVTTDPLEVNWEDHVHALHVAPPTSMISMVKKEWSMPSMAVLTCLAAGNRLIMIRMFLALCWLSTLTVFSFLSDFSSCVHTT